MEISENLVRENGNQAAAVMADYAGGGSGSSGIGIGLYLLRSVDARPITDEDREKLPQGDYADDAWDLNGQMPYGLVNNVGSILTVTNCTPSSDGKGWVLAFGDGGLMLADMAFTVGACVW